MMCALVYFLCALTSALCAGLLWRNYRASRARMLGWSALCFVGLAVNNALLFVDMVIVPDQDLSIVRTLPAVLGFAALLWGFIWDTE